MPTLTIELQRTLRIMRKRQAWFDAASLSCFAILLDGKLHAKIAIRHTPQQCTVIIETQSPERERVLQEFAAKGCGFDRETAALVGWEHITDNGGRWKRQLNDAGFIVVHMQ